MYIDQQQKKLQSTEGKYESLALAFLDDHHAVHRQGADYVWAGTHYQQVEDIAPHIRRWLLRAGIPQSSVMVGNVAAIVRAMRELDPLKYPRVPCWTGGDKGPANCLIFTNCMYEVESGTTRPHSRNFFSPYRLPYDYDPEALCPLWLAFLADSLDADAERIALLQEWAGYLLSADTSQQKYLTCVGPRNCGKGTIAEVLIGLIGIENATGFDLRQLVGRFGASALVNKTLAVVDEVELSGEKHKPAIVERFKAITGEGFVDIEYKGVNVRPSLKLPTRFHVSCNSLPDLKDPSGALGRRLMILPFFGGKSEAQRDVSLKGRLLAELPGICQWALAGLVRLRACGRFTVPKAAGNLYTQSERDGSTALAFVRENCVLGADHLPGSLDGIDTTDEDVGVWRHAIYERAVKWYADHDKDFPPVWFAKDLRALLPRVEWDAKKRADDGKLQRFVKGIALKAMPQ